ncbi:MAG TPA: hypothetical protein VGC39_01980 [Candidatus Methylacidiphilales bacterium]
MSKQTIVKIVSTLGAVIDVVTGTLLISAPQQALEQIHAPAVSEPVLLQFIGVFILSIGLSYVIGLLSWWLTGSIARLRVVWEITLIFRLGAALFITFALLNQTVGFPWIRVPIVDFLFFIVQAALLRAQFLKES